MTLERRPVFLLFSLLSNEACLDSQLLLLTVAESLRWRPMPWMQGVSGLVMREVSASPPG